MAPVPKVRSRFAKWVFLIAAIYGFIIILPDYFLEHAITPPINHVIYYYGFVSLALAWQVAFLIISFDTRRYRIMMLPAVIDKAGFALPAWLLYIHGSGDRAVLPFASIDLIFGILFLIAFALVRSPAPAPKAR